MNLAALHTYLETEVSQPVPATVQRLYASFCAQMPDPAGACGGLFYGSALWKEPTADTVWDLYVLVDRYAQSSNSYLLQLAGNILAPNVYYHETRDETGTVVRGKIAVMRLQQFTAHCRGRVLSPQTWARFAQPVRLIAPCDDSTRTTLITALADATLTFHRATTPWVETPCSIEEFWQTGLRQTYASEFRSERSQRQITLVDASRGAFIQRTTLALHAHGVPYLHLHEQHLHITLPIRQRQWRQRATRLRNLVSKMLHVLRLVKAAFTFAGGVEYLLYKIERHSGVTLEATAFQKKYPLLAAWPLMVKGLRKRAFR